MTDYFKKHSVPERSEDLTGHRCIETTTADGRQKLVLHLVMKMAR